MCKLEIFSSPFLALHFKSWIFILITNLLMRKILKGTPLVSLLYSFIHEQLAHDGNRGFICFESMNSLKDFKSSNFNTYFYEKRVCKKMRLKKQKS